MGARDFGRRVSPRQELVGTRRGADHCAIDLRLLIRCGTHNHPGLKNGKESIMMPAENHA
jgi:hypothetical protein